LHPVPCDLSGSFLLGFRVTSTMVTRVTEEAGRRVPINSPSKKTSCSNKASLGYIADPQKTSVQAESN